MAKNTFQLISPSKCSRIIVATSQFSINSSLYRNALPVRCAYNMSHHSRPQFLHVARHPIYLFNPHGTISFSLAVFILSRISSRAAAAFESKQNTRRMLDYERRKHAVTATTVSHRPHTVDDDAVQNKSAAAAAKRTLDGVQSSVVSQRKRKSLAACSVCSVRFVQLVKR